jgi:hypothetical protein
MLRTLAPQGWLIARFRDGPKAQFLQDIMGFGLIITRALISGAIRAAADVAREQARTQRNKHASKPVREIASVATKDRSLPTTTISARKALRVVAIVDGLLEQTRDEWLPLFHASLKAGSSTPDSVHEKLNDNLRKVASQLLQMGFPYDTDLEFWSWVTDIHLELQVHKALPEAWKEWNEDLDDLLERATAEAKRMGGERRMETLAKLMVDDRFPTDEQVVLARLMTAARELAQDVIVPALTRAGLIEDNLVFGIRLGKLIADIVLRDFLEYSRELAQ